MNEANDGVPAMPEYVTAKMATIFQAMGSPLRLEVIRRLWHGSATTAQMRASEALAGQSRQAIHRALDTLLESGYIARDRRDPGHPWVYYVADSGYIEAGLNFYCATMTVDPRVREELSAWFAQGIGAPPDATQIELARQPMFCSTCERLTGYREPCECRHKKPDGHAG